MRSFNTIIVLLLSILLLILGYYNHYELMHYSMWQLPNVSYIVIGLGPKGDPWLLMIGIALIPMGYFLLNTIVDVRSLLQAVLYVEFTAGCGLCFWWFRILYLQIAMEDLRTDPSVHLSISIDKLQFERYALIGILAGILVTGVLLKIVNRKKRARRVLAKRHEDSLIDQDDKF